MKAVARIEREKDLIEQMDSDVVVSVRNVSKKFCKHLKRSMAYGILDLSKNLVGIKQDTSNIRKEEFWAVRDVSFELRRGEALGIVGANGSGKTTLLKLLNGILPPDKGEIAVRGRMGALISVGAGFHPHMSGHENIYLNGTILGMTRERIKQKFDEIVDFAEIGDFINAPVATYSSGMRVRLGFAIATAINPDVLILDEVLAVGDMAFRAKCYRSIAEMKKNIAVILVSHSMQQITTTCNKGLGMSKGKIGYYGDVLGCIDWYTDTQYEFGYVESKIEDIGEVKAYFNGELAPTSLVLDNDRPLEIEVDLEVLKPLGDCRFSFILLDQSQTPHAKYISEPIPLNTSRKFSVRIDNLNLHPGTYLGSIALAGSSPIDVSLWMQSIVQFSVEEKDGGMATKAMCRLEGTLKL